MCIVIVYPIIDCRLSRRPKPESVIALGQGGQTTALPDNKINAVVTMAHFSTAVAVVEGCAFFISIMDQITIDENGFLFVGGLKICRLTNMQMIEFFDRDRRRSEVRGSQFVYCTPQALLQAITEAFDK